METSHGLTEIIIPDFFGKEFRWENLGQVNILVGPNDSGKTTVLRYLTEQLVDKSSQLKVKHRAQDRHLGSGLLEIDFLLDLVQKVDILIIDLIEMTLDLTNQRTIIDRLLKANPNVQLFITTHSPTIFSQGYMTCRQNIQDLIF